jgi:hypothetical protein
MSDFIQAILDHEGLGNHESPPGSGILSGHYSRLVWGASNQSNDVKYQTEPLIATSETHLINILRTKIRDVDQALYVATDPGHTRFVNRNWAHLNNMSTWRNFSGWHNDTNDLNDEESDGHWGDPDACDCGSDMPQL